MNKKLYNAPKAVKLWRRRQRRTGERVGVVTERVSRRCGRWHDPPLGIDGVDGLVPNRRELRMSGIGRVRRIIVKWVGHAQGGVPVPGAGCHCETGHQALAKPDIQPIGEDNGREWIEISCLHSASTIFWPAAARVATMLRYCALTVLWQLTTD